MKKRMIKNFFGYAREREAIRIRREDHPGQPPWTPDPILQKYRFCNVFREDDTVTQWFRKNVREPLRDNPVQVLRSTIVFRWFNRVSTGKKILDLLRRGGFSNYDKMRRELTGIYPLISGAYMIKTPGGMNKLEGLIYCFEKILPHTRWLAKVIQEGRSIEMATIHLSLYPYLGKFMAYEIVTDLRHTCLLDNATDTNSWANPGPGAHRGLQRLGGIPFKQRLHDEQMQEGMLELLKLSRDIGYWPNRWKPWEMREVEHTLCEFDKYERARLGEGRPKQLFRGGTL